MSNIDWERLVTKAMSDAALAAEQAAIQVATEEQWQRAEMESIAGQLLALEDGDPIALPGNDRAWRDYRIQVRAWKEGAAGYPDQTLRPVRPI